MTEIMASEWSVGIDDLWEAALDNLEDEECSIMDIRHFVPEDLRREADGARMYVCGMQSGNYGAKAILKRGLLKRFAG